MRRVCDANAEHEGPLWAILAGDLSSLFVTEMYFCERCTKTVQWAKDNIRIDEGDTARLTYRGQEIKCDEIIISPDPVYNTYDGG